MAQIQVDDQLIDVPDDATPAELDAIAADHASKSSPSLAEQGAQAVTALGKGMAETAMPPTSMDDLKRLLDVHAGKYGLSKTAQDLGEYLHGKVAAVSPTAAKVLPPLTPETAAEQIGTEAGLQAVGPLVKPVGKAVETALEGSSGLRHSAPGVLAEIAENPAKLVQPGKAAAKPLYEAAEGLADAPAKEGAMAVPGTAEKAKDFAFAGLEKHADIFDKAKELVSNGRQLTPDEALAARQAVDSLYKSGSYSKKALLQWREFFDQTAKQTYGAADAAYAAGKRADAARSLWPLTKAGDPAHMRSMATVAATVLGQAHPSALVTDALFSPLVQSLGAAGLGVGRKALPAIVAGALQEASKGKDNGK